MILRSSLLIKKWIKQFTVIIIFIFCYGKSIGQAQIVTRDTILCGTNRLFLSAIVPSTGTGSWEIIRGDGIIADENASGTSITQMPFDTVTVVTWKLTTNSTITYDTVKIETVSLPDVIPDDPSVCAGDSIELQALGGESYLWSPDRFITDISTQAPKVYPPEETTYTVNISHPRCGSSSIVRTVKIAPDADIITDESVFVASGSPTQLFTSGIRKIEWFPSALFDDPEALSPFVTTDQDTTVIAIGENIFGCTDSVRIKLTVGRSFEIFIPDLFTPNDDGENDVLYANVIGITEFNFVIFDRYGKELFNTKDPDEGWDGTLNGQILKADTYLYTFEGTSIENEEVTKTGKVTLIR